MFISMLGVACGLISLWLLALIIEAWFRSLIKENQPSGHLNREFSLLSFILLLFGQLPSAASSHSSSRSRQNLDAVPANWTLD